MTNVIYAFCDEVGNVRYIGKTNDLTRRYKRHLTDARLGSSFPVHCWIRKHGGSVPSIRILEEVDDYENLNEAEVYWIAKLRTENGQLLNMTNGGDGVTQTPEIRAKIAAIHLGRKFSKEHCAKISEANIGKNLGRKFSKEHRAKISEAMSAFWKCRRLTITHCIHGHEYTTENTLINSRGYRECQTCRRERAETRRRRNDSLVVD